MTTHTGDCRTDPHEDDDYDYDENPWCHRCDGTGEIMICIDDMCHGQDYCIHGDGVIMCPTCKGSGDATPLPTKGAMLVRELKFSRMRNTYVRKLQIVEPSA